MQWTSETSSFGSGAEWRIWSWNTESRSHRQWHLLSYGVVSERERRGNDYPKDLHDDGKMKWPNDLSQHKEGRDQVRNGKWLWPTKWKTQKWPDILKKISCIGLPTSKVMLAFKINIRNSGQEIWSLTSKKYATNLILRQTSDMCCNSSWLFSRC